MYRPIDTKGKLEVADPIITVYHIFCTRKGVNALNVLLHGILGRDPKEQFDQATRIICCLRRLSKYINKIHEQ